MKTLHLNLKRKWFDMIKSGEKMEEYREMKPYWHDRLFKGFDTITFSNGYAKDRDQFVIKLLSIHQSTGLMEWGAERGVTYLVLRLGEIVDGS